MRRAGAWARRLAGTRKGHDLLVERGRRNDDGIELRLTLDTPCVAFSDADTEQAQLRGTVDLAGDL